MNAVLYMMMNTRTGKGIALLACLPTLLHPAFAEARQVPRGLDSISPIETLYQDTDSEGRAALLLDQTAPLQMAIESSSNGMVSLGIGWPSYFTNQLEIYATTNLSGNKWELIKPAIETKGKTNFAWSVPASGDLSFYMTGNADVDTDGDGLSDAREALVFGTDPQLEDTDGDGVSDGNDAFPTIEGPSISISEPAEWATLTNNIVMVSGSVVFTGFVQSVMVNSEEAALSTNSIGAEFAATLTYDRDGDRKIRIRAMGERDGMSLESEVHHSITVNVLPPDLRIIEPSGIQIATSRYVHVSIQSDDAAPTMVDGSIAAQDGFMNLAWIELHPGSNTIAIESTDAFGRTSSETLDLFCDVPSGYEENPPADIDQDGVLDAVDYAPYDASVYSTISITSYANGIEILSDGDSESLESARTMIVEGTAADAKSVRLHVRGLHGPWGTDYHTTASVDSSGYYRKQVKLFPGPNIVTVGAGSEQAQRRINLTIDPPDLQVVYSRSGSLSIDLWFIDVLRRGCLRGDDHDKLYMDQNRYDSVFPAVGAETYSWNNTSVLDIPDARPGIYDLVVEHAPVTVFDPDIVETVAIFINGQLSDVMLQTVYNIGAGFSYPMETKVSFGIHSGEYAGAYKVGAGRYRDLPSQGEILGRGHHTALYDVVEMEGPNDVGPILMATGESIQVDNATRMLDSILSLVPEVEWPEITLENTLTCLGLVGGTSSNAFVDKTGCFTAAVPGHYQVAPVSDSDPETGPDPIDIYVYKPPLLVPDYNRDGVFDDAEMTLASAGKPFRFWINDDDDDPGSEVSGNDIPNSGNRDCDNQTVDGMRDLIDFFPVMIELDEILCDADAYTFHLVHEDAAVKFAYTQMTTTNSMQYLEDVDVAEVLCNADLDLVFPDLGSPEYNGTKLNNPDFIERIETDHEAVLLIEGFDHTAEPLVLEIRDKVTGQTVASAQLNLCISGVEDMYRWVNLRNVVGGSVNRPTANEEPSNFPDRTSSGNQFVFVHGYNVSEEAARGWNAEIFKRLYQSGSNSRFHAVTWRGNQTQLQIPVLGSSVTPDYHVNVVNALKSAQALQMYINELSGHTIIAGHSLGNMIVGAAVARWGANVDKWFMINGAVAIENFDGSSGVHDTNMMHPDWSEYANRLWCSEWHELFGVGDYRSMLTWRDYFTHAVSKTYNFYSSGEDVLQTHQGDPGLIDVFSGQGAWCLQEKRKGRNWISSIGGSTYGGWGFNYDYDSELYKGVNHVQLLDAQLSTNVFFKPGANVLNDLYDPALGNDFAGNYMYELLAGFVPARTLPCGANRIAILDPPVLPDRNYDMNNLQNGWPYERGANYGWLHSDIKNLAFPYVFRVFDEFATEGGLKE